MATKAPDTTVTQILYLTISPKHELGDVGTDAGKKWAQALDAIESSAGFRRLCWGRRVEIPEQVHVYTVRDDIAHNTAFLASPLYSETFLPIITMLITGSPSDIKIRNAHLEHQVLSDPFGKELLGYPIGTAIYKGVDDAWHEGAWPLWTHVVRHVDGCMGIAGGEVVESVEGHDRSYLVFVGWETVKKHEDYHHTEHFQKHFIILNIGHKGYTEYGHVVFQGVREKSSSKL
ncbi:hypothetical protein Daus18300_012042 [Diaporthe australafricana]|uniref:ABM domain-containing protein n=1 Tax=Diaporthe australafricana TaxID=127596 RepID=A0ABR3W464_9PEZI